MKYPVTNLPLQIHFQVVGFSFQYFTSSSVIKERPDCLSENISANCLFNFANSPNILFWTRVALPDVPGSSFPLPLLSSEKRIL